MPRPRIGQETFGFEARDRPRHDLSDVKLAAALDERASFRRISRLLAVRADAGANRLRFRRVLVALELDPGPLRERQRSASRPGGDGAVTVKTGTLVDATVIASASEEDGEAGWSGHRARKAIHISGRGSG